MSPACEQCLAHNRNSKNAHGISHLSIGHCGNRSIVSRGWWARVPGEDALVNRSRTWGTVGDRPGHMEVTQHDPVGPSWVQVLSVSTVLIGRQ